jgi:PadR family transcriptional regulator, regulatory protein PadR
MSEDAPLGTFEEQVMVAVLRMGDDAYGMSVRREIERLTPREISIGAVYSTLDRLEAKGLLCSRRDRPEGSRRVFTVTTPGVHALAASRAMRERLWKGVELDGLLPDGAG